MSTFRTGCEIVVGLCVCVALPYSTVSLAELFPSQLVCKECVYTKSEHKGIVSSV